MPEKLKNIAEKYKEINITKDLFEKYIFNRKYILKLIDQ